MSIPSKKKDFRFNLQYIEILQLLCKYTGHNGTSLLKSLLMKKANEVLGEEPKSVTGKELLKEIKRTLEKQPSDFLKEYFKGRKCIRNKDRVKPIVKEESTEEW